MALTVSPTTLTLSVAGANGVQTGATVVVSGSYAYASIAATCSDYTKAHCAQFNGVTNEHGSQIGIGPADTFQVKAIASGSPTITFTDSTGQTGTCAVTVNA
jgi:hypothetical protein